MVVNIPRIDVGGDIGKGLGQAGAGLAESLYLKNQIGKLSQDIRDNPDRTGIDLLSMAVNRIGGTPQGRALIPSIMGIMEQSAGQLPAGAQPQQPQGQPQTTGFTGGASDLSRSLGDSMPGQSRTETQSYSPSVEEVQNKVESSPSVRNLRPNMDDLIYEPESFRTGTIADQEAYYSAPPIIDPQERLQLKQELLSSGKAKNDIDAERMVEQRQTAAIRDWERGKTQFDRQKAQVDDTLAEFTPRFQTIAGDQVDEEFLNGSRLIAEDYALQRNEKGQLKYTPKQAAEMAAKDIRQMSDAIKKARTAKPLALTESAFPGWKKKKINELKPAIETAKKFGMTEYMKNQLMASGALSPSETSALFYPPRKELIDAVQKIPDRVAKSYDDWLQQGLQGAVNIKPEPTDQMKIQAIEIMKSLQPDDSLVVTRALLNDKGFDESDFNELYAQAQGEGWEPSERQEREYQAHLGRPVRYDLSDIWHGRTRSFMEGLLNIIGLERN